MKQTKTAKSGQTRKVVVSFWGLIAVIATTFAIIWFCPGTMYGYGPGLSGLEALSFFVSIGMLLIALGLLGIFTYITYRVRKRRGAYGDFKMGRTTIFRYWLPMISVLSLSAIAACLVMATLGPGIFSSIMPQATYHKIENERKLFVEFSLRAEQAPWSTSAFQDAIFQGDWGTIKRYLRYGADPKAKNGFGQTALHISVLTSNVPLTRLFLRQGVDINARDREDETPLHDACKKWNIEITRLLIEAGAEINAISEFGTPLDIAEDYQNTEAIEVLKQKGAKSINR